MTHPNEPPATPEDCNTIVHIGPPMHPHEITMGHNVLYSADRLGVEQVVLMAVTQPQLEPLLNPPVQARRRTPSARFAAVFTILRPTHYMRNVDVSGCLASGRFPQPYSLDRPLSFVDFADDGAAVTTVLSAPDERHRATYELCGTDILTGHDIATTLTNFGGASVRAEQVPVHSVLPAQAPDYTIDGFTRLVNHYDRYGILGSPNVLCWLRGRGPTAFAEYVGRELR